MDGFSFVDEFAGGMQLPGLCRPLAEELAFLAGAGVSLLVSLTDEPVPVEEIEAVGMRGLHLPIPDMMPPTYPQQVTFVEEVFLRAVRNESVCVHCMAGLGRTGTMLATWLVASGMDPAAAVAAVRERRPGSIETAAQEESVRAFAARWASER